MNYKKNILIVGGTGFIGYHLAKKSLKKGWQVTSISTKPPPKKRHLSNVKYIFCDIAKKKLVKAEDQICKSEKAKKRDPFDVISMK